jgi:hypothetical protein
MKIYLTKIQETHLKIEIIRFQIEMIFNPITWQLVWNLASLLPNIRKIGSTEIRFYMAARSCQDCEMSESTMAP